MKKLFTILIVLATITAHSQTQEQKAARYFVNECIEKTEAVIIKDTIIDGIRLITTQLPAYFDIDILKSDIRNIRVKYLDVETVENWTLKSDDRGLKYWLVLGIGSTDIYFFYRPKSNLITYSFNWSQ